MEGGITKDTLVVKIFARPDAQGSYAVLPSCVTERLGAINDKGETLKGIIVFVAKGTPERSLEKWPSELQ